MEGILFDIKHCAIHDGPGIRTTVFFKGCPLRCWWCHNPESINPGIEKLTRSKKLGQKEFLEETEVGKQTGLDDLLQEIEKDLIFFEESGGGVTFSGGEPLMQPEYLKKLAERCKKAGIHTTLDTSGHANQSALKKVLPQLDLILFDIKSLDEKTHIKYTGASNKQILKNLQYIREQQKKVVIRYPLIPGVNNTPEQLTSLKSFMKDRFREIHFLPYHKIAAHKYKQLNKDYKMPDDVELLTKKYLEDLKADFEQNGFQIKIGG
jgi:pyruvate formate lyase activating enzyme